MIRIESLHRPASTLSPPRAAHLHRQITRLRRDIADTLAWQALWSTSVDDHLKATDILDLAWEGDKLVGLLAERHLTLGGHKAVFIEKLMVDPTKQTEGLGRRLAGRSVLRTNLQWRGRDVFHVSRTTNPHVAAATWNGLRTGDAYYPSFDPARPARPDLIRAARELAASMWPDKKLHEDTGVIEGAFGSLLNEVPPTRHGDVARYFDAHVDRNRGDAILNVIRYGPRTWLRLLGYFHSHRLRRLWRRMRRRIPRQRTSPSNCR